MCGWAALNTEWNSGLPCWIKDEQSRKNSARMYTPGALVGLQIVFQAAYPPKFIGLVHAKPCAVITRCWGAVGESIRGCASAYTQEAEGQFNEDAEAALDLSIRELTPCVAQWETCTDAKQVTIK